MDANYWKKKWEALDIGFHRPSTNPNLIKAHNQIPPGKVFVPLCGKTLDMDWLEKNGHEVVGAELSPLACQAFFEENQRPYEIIKQGEFSIYQSKNITLWCGDYFKMPPTALLGVTSVFDRAALVALPEAMRKSYVSHLFTLVKNLGPLREILVTFEYDQKLAEGPPHSVPENEVRSLYSKAKKIELIERHDDPGLRSMPKFAHLPSASECLYVIDIN